MISSATSQTFPISRNEQNIAFISLEVTQLYEH